MVESPLVELTWTASTAEKLGLAEMYDVLAMRIRGFVVEQACAYQELDGEDLGHDVWHLLGRTTDDDGDISHLSTPSKSLVAYARILPPDTDGDARIGRVIVSDAVRGQQLGRRLMEQALEVCAKTWPDAPVVVAAQAHLAEFYASFGFETIGSEYDEDGIPHLDMRLSATA